ncbi:secondary thiamine-phosphate synthase enzyme YjbQ [Kallotenue papyrolyticum]|uniref:secondary thiamine-phosphate synthase enzyme YjbQ n=1 Tax=Kallotenue papyrolyticum TaxID=1325125 RepID=UPI0004785DA2|nr:secondary thiamine-phosphate synthase enzyme YjbQ [Kallotenue papyrolyticum]
MIHRVRVRTEHRLQFVDITAQIETLVAQSGLTEGTLVLYCPHTTCGLTIQENADPGVQHDMLLLLERLAPREDARYRHIEDNSAAHLQASLMGFSQTLLIENGRPLLGRWQAIYLCEFDGPRERQVLVRLSA